MTNPSPVELFVRLNAFPALLLTKLNEVFVPPKVKSIFLPFVVVIVFPPAYADCNVTVLAEHLVTLFDESRQIDV